jgi:hypothetical protein
MFPPPRPWKQIVAVDSDRDYVTFTSRFFLRSPLRVPSFMRQGARIMKQADEAAGIVGWSLGANLPTLEFYTLSAWQDEDSLRTFIRAGDHGEALRKFARDMRRDSIFVQFTVTGRDLPLTWRDAVARQNAAGLRRLAE